jgi:ribosome-binding protein aMBF1 (putative translation factor)
MAKSDKNKIGYYIKRAREDQEISRETLAEKDVAKIP